MEDFLPFCWGDQWDRAAGTFDAGENLREPIPVRGDRSFLVLSAGQRHTCGIALEGTLFCWGDNSAGQVRPEAPGGSFFRPQPVQVEGREFVAVAAGRAHSCALTAEGRVLCWGSNHSGQLGNSTLSANSSAVWVDTEARFVQIAVGADHSCGITGAGAVFCWGSNAQAQSGLLPIRHAVRSPAAVELFGAATFRALSAGFRHACALRGQLEVVCWGDNQSGQLGAAAPGEAVAVVALPAEHHR